MQRITPTSIALSISIIMGCGFLAQGYSLAGLDSFLRWFLFFGLFWLAALYNHWDWFSAIALIHTILASALGLWVDLHSGWLIAASIFSLIAWDLTEFRRQTRAMPKDNLRRLEQRHLARLSILAFAGLTFASLLLFLRGQFTMDWGLSFIVITILLLGQFIIGLKTK